MEPKFICPFGHELSEVKAILELTAIPRSDKAHRQLILVFRALCKNCNKRYRMTFKPEQSEMM